MLGPLWAGQAGGEAVRKHIANTHLSGAADLERGLGGAPPQSSSKPSSATYTVGTLSLLLHATVTSALAESPQATSHAK